MLTALALSLSLFTATAAESEFAGTTEPAAEVEKPEASASVELGGLFTSGNAQYYTVNGALRGSYKWKRNQVSALGGVNIGAGIADADGDGTLGDAERSVGYSRNVQRYYAEGRYDRFFSDRDSMYVLAGAFADPFAGYDLRSHEQIGYSRKIVTAEKTTLVGEIGFDIAQENYIDGVDPNYMNIYAARGMLGLTHAFNDNVSFTNTFEAYENVIDLADLRILNTATLSAQLTNRFALKLSNTLIFDNVPVEGFRKLDQTTMATIVATLL